MIPIANNDGKDVLTDDQVKQKIFMQARMEELKSIMALPRHERRRYRFANGATISGSNVPFRKD